MTIESLVVQKTVILRLKAQDGKETEQLKTLKDQLHDFSDLHPVQVYWPHSKMAMSIFLPPKQ